ncbi:hypothetical protein [Leifsonia sp. 22587]|uniref:SbtR family transcriptional regulator n=1 Tax=Leifsonia sp. 22587 TaxID=3453946 RepID=UPI003F85176E
MIEADIAEAVAAGVDLADEFTPADALIEWLVYLAWHLRIWHDLPYCLADAHMDRESPVAPSTTRLIAQTQVLLERAQAAGAARPDVSAAEIFELITAVSWATDRFGDNAEAARRRALLATAGLIGAESTLEAPTQRASA